MSHRNDLIAHFCELLNLVSLGFPGVGVSEFAKLEIVEKDGIFLKGLLAIKDYNKRFAFFNGCLLHRYADYLVALEFL